MDQAQHYDIASLLSCLNQIRHDNERLEERLRQLTSRREHLLSVNARLALPLNGSFPGSLSHLTAGGQLAGHGPHSLPGSSLPSFIPPPPPSMHHLMATPSSPLVMDSASGRRLSSSSVDPMSNMMNGRYPALGMDPGTLNSIFPGGGGSSAGPGSGFNLNTSLRSTPSPSSRSSPFGSSSGRPVSVNPRDPLGLNASPSNHHHHHHQQRPPPDKR